MYDGRLRLPAYAAKVLKSKDAACINSGQRWKVSNGMSSLESLLKSVGGERRINYDLARFQAALDHTRNPEQFVYSLVVAGTNGKGSTALYLTAALTAAGYRTGSFLSPHLQSPTERFLNNLVPISEAELTALAQEFLPTAKKFDLTYFEFLTLLFFHWAKRQEFQFVVLEVGLGGRLDATNVTRPIASVITNIARDHEKYLGDTLPKILEEKLGVLRPEGLLFTGVREPELLQRIEEKCAELDAIYYYSKELDIRPGQSRWDGQSFTLNENLFEVTNPTPGTIQNAALAFLLCRIAFPRISLSTLQMAFRSVRTPGRMEVISTHPRVVLSGDHNPAGIECLKATLRQLPVEKLTTVCAFSLDKPYAGMYQSLAEISDEIVLTTHSRQGDSVPEEYRGLGQFVPDPVRAVEGVLEKAHPEDTILITGSLYLVGEVRKLWRQKVEFLDTAGRGWERPRPPWGGSTATKLRREAEEQSPSP